MSKTLPGTGETVEQSIRRFADKHYRRLGLVNGAAELDAIADRTAALEREVAICNKAGMSLEQELIDNDPGDIPFRTHSTWAMAKENACSEGMGRGGDTNE